MHRGTIVVGVAAVLLLLSPGATDSLASTDTMTFGGIVCADLSCEEDAYGLDVVAQINGNECGHAVTGPHGFEWTTRVWAGFSDMHIASESEIPGCGRRRYPIQFFIDGRLAHQTNYEWDAQENPGAFLSVGDAAFINGWMNHGDSPILYPCDDLCNGPVVEAFVDGTKCGELQTEADHSTNTFSFLIVAGADSKSGCAEEGDVVTFTVDGVTAHETFEFTSGQSDVGLTIGTRSARFRGLACIDSDCGSAKLGRPVVAKIGDVVCGETLTDFLVSDGQVTSMYEILVKPAEQVPGCGTEGATVDFYLDGRMTPQTAPWTENGQTSLYLQVGPDFAAFSGPTTCNGKPCYSCFSPCQTATIKAYIGDVLCGSMTPYGWLIVNYYGPLIVKSAEAQPGCGTPGATVTFKINDLSVAETATWTPGFHWQSLTGGDVIWGDHDCSGVLNAADTLRILRYEIDPHSAGMPCFSLTSTLNLQPFSMNALWADIDCSGVIDMQDALKTLLAAGATTIQHAPGCPPPGATLQAYPIITP